MRTGIDDIPLCIRGLCVMLSLYAYADLHRSIPMYAYGGIKDPHMNTGIYMTHNPRVHTGITEIPICIRVSHDTNPSMHTVYA